VHFLELELVLFVGNKDKIFLEVKKCNLPSIKKGKK